MQVAAVLLAAGRSKRMGTPKQLLPLGNKTVIRHCTETLGASGIEDLVVVIGAQYEECVEALKGTPARFCRNEAVDSQMADSMRIALRSLDDACSGVLVCLADHPLVKADTYRAIINHHRRDPGKIIIPAFQGRRGHPSLFPLELISDLFFTDTLRDIIRQNEERIMQFEVPDEGIILDLDTRKDYQAMLARFSRRNGAGPSGE